MVDGSMKTRHVNFKRRAKFLGWACFSPSPPSNFEFVIVPQLLDELGVERERKCL